MKFFYILASIALVNYMTEFYCKYYFKNKSILVLSQSEKPSLSLAHYNSLSETEKLVFWNKKGTIKE